MEGHCISPSKSNGQTLEEECCFPVSSLMAVMCLRISCISSVVICRLSSWHMGRKSECWPVWNNCRSCSVLSYWLLHLAQQLCCQSGATTPDVEASLLNVHTLGCNRTLVCYNNGTQMCTLMCIAPHKCAAVSTTH